MADTSVGACFRGAVKPRVSETPTAMGHCRLRSGRSVDAFTLRPPEAVEVPKGAEHAATYHKTEVGHRRYAGRAAAAQ